MEKIILSSVKINSHFKLDNGEIYTRNNEVKKDKIGALDFNNKQYFFKKDILVMAIENPRDDQWT